MPRHDSRQLRLDIPGLEPDSPADSPGPPCLSCGGDTVVTYPASRGPHHGRIQCADCGAWRWLPKPKTAKKRREKGRQPIVRDGQICSDMDWPVQKKTPDPGGPGGDSDLPVRHHGGRNDHCPGVITHEQ
jgi:hypothetical protein